MDQQREGYVSWAAAHQSALKWCWYRVSRCGGLRAATNGALPGRGTCSRRSLLTLPRFLQDIFGVPADSCCCLHSDNVFPPLALTSVDAVARIGCMSLQELFQLAPGKEKTLSRRLSRMWSSPRSHALVSVASLRLHGGVICRWWLLFGSANQLLQFCADPVSQCSLRLLAVRADALCPIPSCSSLR